MCEISSARRRRKTGTLISLALISALWCLSTPLAAEFLRQGLEGQYIPQRIETYPQADVAIVLGGGLSPPHAGNPYPDLSDAGDRVLHVLRIYQSGKARRLLISGGTLFDTLAVDVEATAMADFLVSLGVDRSAILIETKSRNTRENATESYVIWRREGFTSGLLVTSASHMARALATFRKAGMAVEPASTDSGGDAALAPIPLPLLPDAGSLNASTKYLKEWLGFIVYRWRGWV